MSHLISDTFEPTNFQENDPVPEESLPVLKRLYEEILVPVMQKFGSIVSDSGHRSVTANKAAHGQPNSEHIYTAEHVADDFYSPNVPARIVFDWMRLNPVLPFHQLILEHSQNGFTIIHVSMNVSMPGVRSVKEGATHNAGQYVNIDHVAFNPQTNHDAVQDATA